MRIPAGLKVAVLVVLSTAFYTYVGQLVPQKELPAPQEFELPKTLSTTEMVKIGEQIANGKGLCLTCHTVGRTGVLRFPDLAGVVSRAETRIPGKNALDYLLMSVYEPDAFVVPGFERGMPPIHKPPIGLTDDEIMCVIAWLQSLGGTPTVTLETPNPYRREGGG